ncbi:uncharacterized protein LOC101849054 [Aplysia californica]|uniref:Uncharacterized protein LOC101849054 n=1 Tax=Aplysia californica TaxID=6500 RepID=A0ABM1A153_APLCA|nr:uncharacterized protein LOC101849054 [Aplysia californica]
MLQFAANLTEQFTLGPDDIRFGAVVFSEVAKKMFDLKDYSNHSALSNAITSAPYLNSVTYTNKAFDMVRNGMFSGANGGRQNASKIVILFTDGQSTEQSDTLAAAVKLNDTGVRIISIGIADADEDELDSISNPEDVFLVAGFDALQHIQNSLTTRTCDVPTKKEDPVVQDKCTAKADIVFVMDSSGSIGSHHYKTQLEFLANITDSFTVGPNDVQFGTVVFSSDSRVLFYLNNFTNHADIRNAIMKAPFLSSVTYTNLGLKLAREQVLSPSHGARPNVTKLVIVITDGESTNPDQTHSEAARLKATGAQVLAIGVGDHTRRSELEDIASAADNVIEAAGYTTLDSIGKLVGKQACKTAAPAPMCHALADIIFLLDSSGSIGKDNYAKQLKFAANMTRQFRLGPNDVRFGVVLFGDAAHGLLDLDDYDDHTALSKAIVSARYLDERTFTNLGLDYIRNGLFDSSHGGRDNASKIVIVMTDGESTEPTNTQASARLLRADGVRIITIGIADADLKELQDMSTSQQDVFQVAGFDALDKIQHSVANRTCEDHVTLSKPDVRCRSEADVIFVMDSSGSIGTKDYARQLQWAVNLTDNFQLGSGDMQFGAVIFSDTAQKLFDLNKYSDHVHLSQALTSASYMASLTRTDLGLSTVKTDDMFDPTHGGRQNATKIVVLLTDGNSDFPDSIVFVPDQALTSASYMASLTRTDLGLSTVKTDDMFDPTHGGRQNATKIVVLLTDGNSDFPDSTYREAEALKDTGVRIVTIGVGSADQSELRKVASGRGDVFMISDYSALHTVQEAVASITCEPPAPPIERLGLTCKTVADIVFVLDASGSIDDVEWAKVLNFAASLTTTFVLGPNDIQVGAIAYSDDAQVEFDLDDYVTNTGLYAALEKIPNQLGYTYTNEALDLAEMKLNDTSFGARDEVPKLVLVITDGLSSDKVATSREAESMKAAGTILMAVGVESAHRPELEQMATSLQDIFEVDDFDALRAIRLDVANKTCQNVPPPPPTTAPPTTPPPIICQSKADVLLVLDTSYSVDDSEWVQMLNFTSRLTDSFKIGPDAIQVGALTFSNDVYPQFSFNSYTNNADVQQAVLKLPKSQGATYTGKALEMARKQIDDTSLGARPNVTKIVVVVTDGASTVKQHTVEEAKLLKNAGAVVLAIGIQGADRTELETIASEDNDVFEVTNFDALSNILKGVANQTCENVQLLFSVPSHKQSMRQTILVQAIKGAFYMASTTDTDIALNLVGDGMFDSENGGRDDAAKVVIVMTDGRSDNVDKTKAAAEKLRKSGIMIISIGIANANPQELKDIASTPEDVFQVAGFDSLHEIGEDLAIKTCAAVPTSRERACTPLADIILVMDSSGSINSGDSGNYDRQLDFAATLTKNFDLGPDDVRFGGVIFSDTTEKLFDLKDYSDHKNLSKAITGARYIQSTTKTDLALNLVDNGMFDTVNGGRDNAQKIVIVMTDGQSDDMQKTKAAAEKLKKKGVTIIAIGIAHANTHDLENIASGSENVVQVSDFHALDKIEHVVTNRTCEAPTPPPRVCTPLADIILVMDSSGSINMGDSGNYDRQLDFAANLTKNFDLGPDDVRFGGVIFSDIAEKLFDLKEYSDHNSLSKAIKAARYIRSTTRTDLALNMVKNGMFDTAHGGRDNAQKIVIVMTDGQSDNMLITKEAAQKLKDAGVTIIAIGIAHANALDLENIASGSENVIQVSDFHALDRIEHVVANRTCEAPTPPPRACTPLADIILVMDSSGSINNDDSGNYDRQLDFAANLTKNFDLGPDDVRFGGVIFSDTTEKLFDLKDYSDHNSLSKAIKAARYIKRTTRTDLALNLVNNGMFDTAHGGRDNAQKIVIVMTDGQSDNMQSTKDAAQKLKDAGVTIIAIGIAGANAQELENIASGSENVIQVSDFHALDKIEQVVANRTCEELARPSLPPPKCTPLADIILVMDSSGSINYADPGNYDQQLDFAANLTQNFDLGPNDVRFGAVIFAGDINKLFDLKDYSDHKSLTKAIKSARFIGTTTNTDKALDLVGKGMFDTVNGGRDKAQKIVIIMTDGASNSNSLTKRAADALKKQGVTIISIGIAHANAQELGDIASGPDDVFQVAGFSALNKITSTVADRTCDVVQSPKIICTPKADVILVMDSSGSINLDNSDNYDHQLQFVANLTENFKLGPQDVEFGAVIFGTDAKKLFDLNDHTNHNSLSQALLSAPYLDSNTHTEKALSLVNHGMFDSSNGGRADASKIVIVLTDGQSMYPSDTKNAAKALKDKGILVIAIGIAHADKTELQNIATSSKDVFTVTGFDALYRIQEAVANRTCELEASNAHSKRAPVVFEISSSSSEEEIFLPFRLD